jgi:RHS repeat-associated protein
MQQEGSIAYVVDASGNVVQRGKETYEYDQANRLVNSRMPQPTLYVYDGDGKRVSTNAGPGPIQTHVYDVNSSLPMLLYDGRRQYVYGVGLAYAVDGNGQLEIYHTDGLGSVRAVSYANGNVVQNYLTDAFGVVVKTEGSHNQPFQYAGEERDKETELYYLRARYYDPRTGRFMQRDPFAGIVADPGSLHHYVYVENSPTSKVDPSGLFGGRVLRGGSGCGIDRSCQLVNACYVVRSCPVSYQPSSGDNFFKWLRRQTAAGQFVVRQFQNQVRLPEVMILTVPIPDGPPQSGAFVMTTFTVYPKKIVDAVGYFLTGYTFFYDTATNTGNKNLRPVMQEITREVMSDEIPQESGQLRR